MGYLKRYGDRKYRIIYDLPPERGKRRQKRETLEGASRRQAEAILAEREATVLAQRKAIENGDQVKDEVALGELFDKFMDAKRATKESTTVNRYATYVSLYLRPRFGSMKAGSLKPFHLTDAYTQWQAKGPNGNALSGRTVRHVHETLREYPELGRSPRTPQSERRCSRGARRSPEGGQAKTRSANRRGGSGSLKRGQVSHKALKDTGVSQLPAVVLSGGSVRGVHGSSTRGGVGVAVERRKPR